ncbi:phasin family protein [Malikia granosa]|nr:phasin family protein [Malikia granosa]
MLTTEQIIAAQQAQLKALHELSTHYLSSVKQLTALNLRLSQDTLNDQTQQAQASLNAKDGQELLQLHGNSLQPHVDRIATYTRHLMDIVSHWGAGVAQVFQAQQEQVRESLALPGDKAESKAGKGSK